MADRRYWFKKKQIGWGWIPATREGWIATALVVVSSLIGNVFVRWNAWCKAALVVAYLALVIKRGEPLW